MDGFGTLDPPCIHGFDVRHNVYSGRHSIYFVPRVSPYVRPPFIPPLSLFLSLYSRYMRVYTFAKKTIILQAGLACGGALCVAAAVSRRVPQIFETISSVWGPLLAYGTYSNRMYDRLEPCPCSSISKSLSRGKS